MARRSYPERLVMLAAALATLLAGLWAGLLRMDLELPMLHAGVALAHGPLMVSGFLGILIGLERAVALERWWAYAAPLLTALGTVLLLVGLPGRAAALLIVLGSAALVGNFFRLLLPRRPLFLVTMALGGAAWLAGNVLWLRGAELPTLVHWWAGFLVLTVAGERLELSRLAAQGAGQRLFVPILCLYLASLAWASADAARGLPAAGAAMLLLAAWLTRFDLARRTLRLAGLPRFIALHLLAGYCWLAVGACFWLRADRFLIPSEWQNFHYDAMLHAIFLGFVFSMIFAHAPIIFPAVTGLVLEYHPRFYLPGALLHLSLALRVGSDLAGDFVYFRWSGVLNVAAVVLFLVNTAAALLAGARRTRLRS